MQFNELAHQLYEKGKEYASVRAKSEMLSESKKSVIASIASKYEWSEATKERIARASDKFKEYLWQVQQVRQMELELKYEIDSITMQFEYYRSMNSVRKKEANIL